MAMDDNSAAALPLEAARGQAVTTGLLASFVGFGSSFAVVVQGLVGVGANPAQSASGLLALSVGMGFLGIVLSLRYRMPISVAWSTPGAALLATTGVPEGGFPAAVGAFLVVGALIVTVGLWKPLGRLVAAIPSSIANAMLAGVLFHLCVAPFLAIAEIPILALPVVLLWAVLARFWRLYAVPAAVILAVVLMFWQGTGPLPPTDRLWPTLTLVTPILSWSALVSIALPLFLVTMASQNIPGFAVLQANDFHPPSSPLIVTTGLGTMLVAPFGGHAVNLAAITAALCAGPDAHPDPARRYIAAVATGIGYILVGMLAVAATAWISASPPLLIEAVAGLALLGAFGSALGNALAPADERDAALVTLIATASGMSFAGIGSAFWGLLAGAIMLALRRLKP
jgi:benzoate membrane transport protein